MPRSMLQEKERERERESLECLRILSSKERGRQELHRIKKWRPQ